MPSLEPIVVYGDFASPNPCKVRIVLEELRLPFRNELVTFAEVKGEAYVKLNPNGRLPTIHDPNTGITLWESGAIVIYLIEQYDKDHAFSFGSLREKYLVQQWIAFQISGQGPYYGQGVWFNLIHPEKLPSVIERFEKEIERVRSVLDRHLSKVASETSSSEAWLVGNKITVADLSWVMWEHVAELILNMKGIKLQGKYPAYDSWIARLLERPTCQKAITRRMEELRKSGLTNAIRDDMKGVTV